MTHTDDDVPFEELNTPTKILYILLDEIDEEDGKVFSQEAIDILSLCIVELIKGYFCKEQYPFAAQQVKETILNELLQ